MISSGRFVICVVIFYELRCIIRNWIDDTSGQFVCTIFVIFRSLGESQSRVLINLVRIMSVSASTLAISQTASACLTALGRPLKAAATQWLSCILRVLLTAVLIKYTRLSVSGAAIAANIAYFVAAALNLWYIIQNGKNRPDLRRSGVRRRSI